MAKTSFDVAVVGGGPAGLTAAYFAANRGLSVVLIERNDKLAKKLRITGKGRCNLTNNCDQQTFLQNVRRGGKFLYSSIYGFSSYDVMDFFEGEGLPLVTERGNRVFPKSQDANDVAKTLIDAAKKVGVIFKTGRAADILTKNGEISGVALIDGEQIVCRAAVIATGGVSYPKTGSTGDGYRMAEQLSHTINQPVASLVPIECDGDEAEMQGLSLKNVELVASRGKKQLFRERGEMLFTHFGISGPLVLTLSSYLVGIDLREVECYIDLKPALDVEMLDKRVQRDFLTNANRDFKNSLDELLPKKMIPVVVRRSGIPQEKKVHSITAKERAALVDRIKHFSLSLVKFRPADEAIVTAGGIALKEIDPKSMMSKKVRHLHFAGEVIDADGYTGGFNLGIAFATGAAAGRHVLAK